MIIFFKVIHNFVKQNMKQTNIYHDHNQANPRMTVKPYCNKIVLCEHVWVPKPKTNQIEPVPISWKPQMNPTTNIKVGRQTNNLLERNNDNNEHQWPTNNMKCKKHPYRKAKTLLSQTIWNQYEIMTQRRRRRQCSSTSHSR